MITLSIKTLPLVDCTVHVVDVNKNADNAMYTNFASQLCGAPHLDAITEMHPLLQSHQVESVRNPQALRPGMVAPWSSKSSSESEELYLFDKSCVWTSCKPELYVFDC